MAHMTNNLLQISSSMFIAVAGVLTCVGSAFGQHGAAMVVQRNDDGGTPQIMHFTMPDFMELRRPDFLKRDVPTFREKLELSEAQQAAIQRQIEEYLAAFEALKKEKLGSAGEPMVFRFGGDGPDGEQGLGAMFMGAASGPEGQMDGIDNLDDLDIEMPAGFARTMDVQVQAPMTVGVGMTTGSDAPAGEGNAQPRVAISIGGPDGAELTDEQRKTLEDQAAKIAEKIKAQMDERMAKGEGQGDAAGGAFGLGGDNIEDFEKHQMEMADQAEAFGKAKAQLRQKFVADAQSQLAQPQVEKWPALERALLREKSLPQGRLSGERTDLFKVVKAAAIDDASRTAIAPQLDQYDLALDSALRQRNDFLDGADEKIDKAIQEQNFDRALSLTDRAAAMHVAVRSVNEQFTDIITNLLPAEKAQAFRAAALKMSYPMVYRKTFGSKTFDAVAKIDGINDSTRTTIAQLQKAYQDELEQVNAQIRKAIDQNDPKEPHRPIEHMKQIAAGNPPPEDPFMMLDDPETVRKAYTKRRELDQRYAKSVAELLTAEQAAQLPKPPSHKPGEPFIIRSTAGETSN